MNANRKLLMKKFREKNLTIAQQLDLRKECQLIWKRNEELYFENLYQLHFELVDTFYEILQNKLLAKLKKRFKKMTPHRMIKKLNIRLQIIQNEKEKTKRRIKQLVKLKHSMIGDQT